MTRPGGNADEAVTAYLQASCPGSFRRVARGEWGVVVDDVEVGLRLDGGWLRGQAWACAPGRADPHELLHHNRLGLLVRYAHSRAGDVHVHGDVPEASVFADGVLDRLLVGLVEAVLAVRTADAS
jgi:hypothetical protein